MSWRRFSVLLEQLPRESRWIRAVAPQAAWGPGEYLQAVTIDLLAGANWQRGGGKGPKPKPLKRPEGRKNGGVKMGRTLSRYDILVSALGRERADERLAADPALATTYGDGTPMGGE